jgi:glycosyltransferase involved in cell wall biosynthesis
MTKISVVVSIRDCRERIIEALESISAQTYPRDNVETIVVDHGSTDMSPALARRFLAHHGMQGSVLATDGDIWAAFDAGWRQARGEWVQFLKGQDLLAPTHLEVLAKAISEADEAVQVACSSWQCLYASGNAGPVHQPGLGRGSILKLITPHTWTLGAALYRKSAIEAVGGFGEGMLFATAERFMLKIAGVGERIRLRCAPFLDVPSSLPMFFEYSDAYPASSRTSVEEHLENILLARLALIERANGDIGADDTETLAAVCEESLRDLLDHYRRAFIRCYQKLHDVDPRLVSAPAIAAAGATTSSAAIAERFALTIPSWRQARQGRPETALDIVRHQPATPRFPIKPALIATAVVAGIAVVLLGTKLTTTLIATARDGKPEQVVEKPGVVVPKINSRLGRGRWRKGKVGDFALPCHKRWTGIGGSELCDSDCRRTDSTACRCCS